MALAAGGASAGSSAATVGAPLAVWDTAASLRSASAAASTERPDRDDDPRTGTRGAGVRHAGGPLGALPKHPRPAHDARERLVRPGAPGAAALPGAGPAPDRLR